MAAFAVNELEDAARNALLEKLLARRGVSVLIVEPIARRRVHPWWTLWRTAFEERGGRADEWRFPVELPHWLAELDHASDSTIGNFRENRSFFRLLLDSMLNF